MKIENSKKLTIKEISRRCNITEQTYHNWKKDKSELIKLIEMGLDMEALIEKYNTKTILDKS
jgi:transcriptional regulator with XRE-family HTH domain